MNKNKKHKILEKRLVNFLNQNYDLQERIKSFREKKLYSLEIELTSLCNLSCFYCYATNEKINKTLNFKKAIEIIDSAKNYGIKKIVWLGGEPTLNPNWEKILRYSKNAGLNNELWSNGTTLLKNADAITKICDNFVLHLDSINLNIFASIQDKHIPTRVYSEILRGLDKLLELSYSQNKIRLNIVLSRRSLPTLENTMKYFYPEKCGSITLIPLFATGKGTYAPSKEFLSPSELKKTFEKRAETEGKPERMLLGTSEYDKWYQMTTVYITAHGDVAPYAGLDVYAGNIYEKNLKQILEDSFDFLSFSQSVSKDGFKNNINGVCRNCENSRYCFGTRANSFFHSGKFLESDNTCWK